MLVVTVSSTGGRRVAVVAASHEPTGDDSAVLVSTEQGLSPVVWSRIRASISTFTFEQRLADLDESGLSGLRHAMAGDHTRAWAPILDDLDDRALVAAELEDKLSALSEAEWLPAKTAGERLDLLLQRAGLKPSALGRALGISPGDARRLTRGERQPSEDELRLLTGMLGTRPAVQVRFDKDLVADLDQPKFRPRLRLYAAAKGLPDEATARRRVASAVLAMAARHRQSGRRNWQALISEVLDEG